MDLDDLAFMARWEQLKGFMNDAENRMLAATQEAQWKVAAAEQIPQPILNRISLASNRLLQYAVDYEAWRKEYEQRQAKEYEE